MLGLPSSTLVNRKIPKNKFYEKLQANNQLKDIFTQQVESIIWKHKLATETISLVSKDGIEEIQVFEIHLKQKSFSQDILSSIDRAIPYPILHVLLYDDHAKLAIAYKERSQTDDNRAVVRSYYQSKWQSIDEVHLELQGLDLKAIYENIIRNLLTVTSTLDVDLSVAMERQESINKLTHDCQRLEAKIGREKQFNRKVDMNMELQRMRRELDKLIGGSQP